MWIKLRLHTKNSEPIIVQTENITTICKNKEGYTDIGFIGEVENYIVVEESIEVIEQLIRGNKRIGELRYNGKIYPLVECPDGWFRAEGINGRQGLSDSIMVRALDVK